MKRIEIGPWRDQTLWWVGNNDGLFIMLDDVKIAERGRLGTPQDRTWVPLQPGWEIKDTLAMSEMWLRYTDPKTGEVIAFPEREAPPCQRPQRSQR
jgi:hypothetical protein